MRTGIVCVQLIVCATMVGCLPGHGQGTVPPPDYGSPEDRRLFEQETFGGNGRTCVMCHTGETGTLSPEQAKARFAQNPRDLLFVHDGSDDGHGNGTTRILKDATILVEVLLHPNVTLADDIHARTVVVRRGIPTTLNTPALDPILMLDGRQTNLLNQAQGALRDHARNTLAPIQAQLLGLARFQFTAQFFSSEAMRSYFYGGPDPGLPEGRTESEKRGRRFFEDVSFKGTEKRGLCAGCHSGPLLNQTNRFSRLPLPAGSRFVSIGVSELNTAQNPVREFIFRNPDGTTTVVKSPDPGRALITGVARNFPFDNLNAFKIPSLRGIRHTAPYFHDNSAKTMEDVMEHYAKFFELASGPSVDGDPPVVLTDQDKKDIVAYMKLLD